ncbi:uncharacterized protein F5147DRAFT_724274 [Suillus discolor]|uniref:Secreted protein n=1 Tax=Suillus discolor TaxID=1912936 RepID=A0A9P7EV78_9AGAM|nr:uncharacterized protein F5147DRAFT_724274 [Suillus discolor]KAG2091041.1 hypothetical protein F5147DRAFT_724274 [Suillus discolor]
MHITCRKLLFWILLAHKKSRSIYYDGQNIFLLCVPAHTGMWPYWPSRTLEKHQSRTHCPIGVGLLSPGTHNTLLNPHSPSPYGVSDI